MIKYCPNCGYEISENTKFCPKCGKNLTEQNNNNLNKSNNFKELSKNENHGTLLTWGWIACALSILIPAIGIASVIISIILISKNSQNENNDKAITLLIVSIIFIVFFSAMWAAI